MSAPLRIFVAAQAEKPKTDRKMILDLEQNWEYTMAC